jgi:Predicted kinase
MGKVNKIIMTLGLPGSGKSTWAKQYQAEHPETVRVNKDELRAMLHNGKHSNGRENFVLQVRDFVVDQALANGHDVIVDDTNFHPKHRQRMEEIAAKHGATVEVKDFTDVPLEICIERDLHRANSVGERVIRQMYRQYVEVNAKIERNPYVPDAILCDLDGTLALFGDANPYDRDVTKDKVNQAVRNILWFCAENVILLSGRTEAAREQTEQ